MSKNKVELRNLGETDIKVSPIGLGVMQFSGGGKGMMSKAFPNLQKSNKNEIIEAALDGGINWFDTAELYGNGRSEASLASALKSLGKKNEEVIIATKWFPLFRTARNIPKTIDDRIRFLDGFNIDLYYIHQPMGFSSPESEMDAMADLVDEGKIKSVGISNFGAERMQKAYDALKKRGIPLAVNQMHYSLLHRNIERDGVLELAKELGITIVAYTPLGYGLLTGIYHKHPELLATKPFYRRRMFANKIEQSRPLINLLEKIANNHGVLPGQVALNWLINFNGDAVVAIPGASKVKHAEESAAAMNFKLLDDEMNELDELSRIFL